MDSNTVLVGIDVGGTKVATGLVDASGHLLATDRLNWRDVVDHEATAEELASHMVERLALLLAQQEINPSRVQAVGLGFPGDFEKPSGRLKTIPNLPVFVGTDPVPLFRTAYAQRLGTAPPAYADNDTVAAVLAETRFGAGRGARRVLYITVSTGVGGARFDGETTTNIEPGLSIFPDPERPECNLESLAGGNHLKDTARHRLESFLAEGEEALRHHTSLFELTEVPGGAPTEQMSHLETRHLGEAAAAGDAFCRSLFDEAAGWVATALAQTLADGWGEERIVMGGSIAIKVPGYLEKVREVLNLHRQQRDAPSGLLAFDPEHDLVPAGLGETCGILGAVLFIPELRTAGQSRRRFVRTINAAQARPLRQAVLRPHQTPEDCVYEGDEDPESAHFGALVAGNLVGIASIYRQREDGQPDPFAWRLRGMATLESVRGQGYGAALLKACERHARRAGGMRLWCNARTTVAGFYGGFGFQQKGEEFDLPGLGPHLVMELEL